MRVEMFLDLAADYASPDRTLALPLSVRWGGESLTDAEYWMIVLHATLLRKFFSSDQVAVGQVFLQPGGCYATTPTPSC